MTLPLPNLDDRRWADLVEEARALIPLYAPEWTDHNVHDPGITLLELFAWLAEMNVYRVNRISEGQQRKLLALAGIFARRPRAARTVLALSLDPLPDPQPAVSTRPLIPLLSRRLPAGAVFSGRDDDGAEIPFRTLDSIRVIARSIDTVQVQTGHDFENVTVTWKRGETIAPFGARAVGKCALYLGFKEDIFPTLPVSPAHPRRMAGRDAFVTLFFVTDDDLVAADAERLALVDAERSHRDACRPQAARCEATSAAPAPMPWTGIEHHSVRTVWEVQVGQDEWLALRPERGEVQDETRAFTLSGAVRLRPPRALHAQVLGEEGKPHFHVRCRLLSGAYDRAPSLTRLILNGVLSEQSESPKLASLLPAGESTFRHTAADGRTVAAPVVPVGTSEAAPGMRFALPYTIDQTVAEAGLQVTEVFSVKSRPGNPAEHEWTQRPDFDASGAAALHYALNPVAGEIRFGDGRHGRVPGSGSGGGSQADVHIHAAYLLTRGSSGNLAGDTVTNASGPPGIACRNPLPATGGTMAESMAEAEGRARSAVTDTPRLVTAKDFERLADEVVDGRTLPYGRAPFDWPLAKIPGVRLARVFARFNVHPAFPCLRAPGIVTLVIVPYLPADRPFPSLGLRRSVAAFIARRRMIGTRVEVVGPTYVDVIVRAHVQARSGAQAATVRTEVAKALDAFFHPLRGGPGGDGWPFGRDVYRSEVLQVIDEVAGVDHVLSLELQTADGGTCGDVCLGPFGLVAAGKHDVIVEGRSSC
ncbi:MAG: putative baseplate assembly protein [Anaerolineae bacterium]